MSEPYQLYARVHISRSALDAFLASSFPDPSGDEAVLRWLSEAKYYGPRYTPEKLREQVVDGRTTVGQWVEELVAPGAWGFPMPVANDYDDAVQTWTLGVMDFSENYDDYAAAVAVFRAIAKIKDLDGDDGLLIYGCMFENDAVGVALRVQRGTSQFLDEASAGWLVAAANVTMDALKAQGAALADQG